MIQIITGDPRPISQQILEGLRRKIAAGELAQGSRLPSVRGLALQLTVSLNTVAKAYRQLSAEGLIESRQGIGVFVCEPKQMLHDEERQRRLQEATRHFVNAVLPLSLEDGEILERVAQELEAVKPREPVGTEDPEHPGKGGNDA